MERRGAKPGERRGGRKAGTPNVATVEREAIKQAAAAQAAGHPVKKTSLDVFEEAMHLAYGLAAQEQAKGAGAKESVILGYLEKAAYFGKLLAPYRHAQLRTITHRGLGAIDMSRYSDADIASIIRLLERGVTGGLGALQGGATQTSH